MRSSTPPARPGAALPDPKDMVPVLKRYRDALDLIGTGQVEQAGKALREILAANPNMTDVWSQYAAVMLRIGRSTDALDAYKAMIRAAPDEPDGLLGAASVLVSLGRLDDARAHAELAVKSAPASAHQALANIALARQDEQEALLQADLAQQADSTLPLRLMVRGTIDHDRGHYLEALSSLTKAREASASRTVQLPDLNYFIGDSLARLERYEEAEPYLREEIRLYPHNTLARSGLAIVYHVMGRPADAERVITDLLRLPSPVAYQMAAKLWRMFDQPARAADVEARSRARFGGSRSP
jgi:tetratricopeptide (TPR) repeat protein